jgi:hypothetical protein
MLLLAPVPPAHLPVGDPDDLGGLPPGNLLRQSSQDHFLNLHRPLQGGHRVAVHPMQFAPWPLLKKRTYRVLITPDTSCANDSRRLQSVVSKLKCPLFRAHDMSGLSLRECRRRDCGKVEIPRFGRDFQARWESPKDFSTERRFHSLPVLLGFGQQGTTLRAAATHHVRPNVVF